MTPDGNQLCICGDPACPHRPQLQATFQGAMLSQEEMDWNKEMSQVKNNMKVQLSVVGKVYVVCTLLQNARSCTYGSL